MDGKIDLHYANGDTFGSVTVHTKCEMAPEMMEMLLKDIRKGIMHWQDRVIAHGISRN